MTGTGLPLPIARLSRAIRDRASGRLVPASLAAFIAATMLLMGPIGIAGLEALTGGPGILDNSFLYTPQEAYRILGALGDAGRAFDLTRIVPLDFLFPLTYMLFFALAISWTLGCWLPGKSRFQLLNLVPLLWGGMDYCENVGIVVMLASWPAQLYAVAEITGILAFLKVVFCIASVLVLLGAVAGWIGSRIRDRCRDRQSPATGPEGGS